MQPRNQQIVENFLEMMLVVQGASKNTIAAYKQDLTSFIVHGEKSKAVFQLTAVTPAQVKGYMQHIAKEGASAKTQARRLAAIRRLFRFMVERKLIEEDPTRDIVTPKIPKTLPKALSVAEVEKLMLAVQGEDPYALRLRLIFELLYATGLRISELITLKKSDILQTDSAEYVLRVIGKGDKTRLVPLGSKASATLLHYLETGHRKFENKGDWLFPSNRGQGQPLTRQRLFQLVKQLGESVGVSVAPHHLRHTFATHLLENDADLRSVQAMLGHSSLATTQIYTKVADKRMQETLDEHHPLNKGLK